MSFSLMLMAVFIAAVTVYYFARTAKRKEPIPIRIGLSAKQHRR